MSRADGFRENGGGVAGDLAAVRRGLIGGGEELAGQVSRVLRFGKERDFFQSASHLPERAAPSGG